MSEQSFRADNLVLYKQRPARVVRIQPKKITIQDESGRSFDVRTKDIVMLHAGPVTQIPPLQKDMGELLDAWELLEGEETTLAELAELAFGEFTPVTALKLWSHIHDGLYFSGQPDAIQVRSAQQVAQEQSARTAKAAAATAWQAFQARVNTGEVIEADTPYLQDIETLALGMRDQSRALRELGITESPEAAHRLLLRLGYWSPMDNPYPRRSGTALTSPAGTVKGVADEGRTDLTHLQALAIDDAGNQDPDDALSVEGERLWVHIADVAAVVSPDDDLDIEARARGSNLYLPEGTVSMLPPEATEHLGLGLNQTSPALSFGLDLGDQGEILALTIVPSVVRVTRMSYADAEANLTDPLLARLLGIAEQSYARRLNNGAIDIHLPEAKVHVEEERIEIVALPALQSRMIVREAMLLTGEAVANYAVDHDIPLAYTAQVPPVAEVAELQQAATLAEYFATRKSIKPGRQQLEVDVHAGLGMARYVQATSPLRRYLDMVAHQQLRAHLAHRPLLSAEQIKQRIVAIQAVMGNVRRAERMSILHWKHVYLRNNPEWCGEGVAVDRRGTRTVVLLPELAMETRVYLGKEVALDSVVQLCIEEVDLPALEAKFMVR